VLLSDILKEMKFCPVIVKVKWRIIWFRK